MKYVLLILIVLSNVAFCETIKIKCTFDTECREGNSIIYTFYDWPTKADQLLLDVYEQTSIDLCVNYKSCQQTHLFCEIIDKTSLKYLQ